MLSRAREAYSNAADLGLAAAQYRLSRLPGSIKPDAGALSAISEEQRQILRDVADAGFGPALLDLALVYDRGYGGFQDSFLAGDYL